MSFHATAAGFSARPHTLSTFRNHLLCSVCAALLVMGSGAMAQEAPPAPEPVVDAKPPVPEQPAPEQPAEGTEQLAPEQPAEGTEQLAPDSVVDEKPPVQEKLAPEQPAEGTEQLAPEPVVDAKPPVQEKLAPEQPAEGTKPPAPEPVVDAKPSVLESAEGAKPSVLESAEGAKPLVPESAGGAKPPLPESAEDAKPLVPESAGGAKPLVNEPAARNVTVEAKQYGAFGADALIGDIAVNGTANVKGQMRNGTVNNEGNDNNASSRWFGLLQLVGSRAKATGTIVVGPADGSSLDVLNGATANEVIVNGTQSKTGDQKHKGGEALVSGKGSRINNGTVNLGGLMKIRNKATAGTITVNNGGWLNVEAGGLVEEVTINGVMAGTFDGLGFDHVGGSADVTGKGRRIDKGTVNLGGLMMVYDQATAGTITVNTGGWLNVKDGSLVEEVTVNGVTAGAIDGLGFDHVGGSADVTGKGSRIDKGTVNLGGLMIVQDKATAGTITVNNGGWLYGMGGAKLDTVSLNGGIASIYSDSHLGTATINNGGTLDVWKNGRVEEVTVNGVGGIANLYDKGSRIDKGTINLGGLMMVYDQAKAGAITVNTGGKLDVFDGGTAEEVTINGEKAWDASGKGGIGGFADVFGAGSRIDKGTVNLGSWMKIRNKATAGTITVNNGGELAISAEGSADTVLLHEGYASTAGQIGTATIGKGSRLDVKDGGKANIVTVNKDGTLDISAEGHADTVLLHEGYAVTYGHIGTATIDKDGQLDVKPGSAIGTVNLDDGAAFVNDRGEITGKSTVSNAGYLEVYVGGRAGDITLTSGASNAGTSRAVVNGTAGDITLGGNSTLSGTGHIRNLWVRAGSTVSPGNSVGTLHADGNVHFYADSIFNVELSPDLKSADKLAVTGHAILGGVVEVRMEGAKTLLSQKQSEDLLLKHFIILTAEKGMTGRFDAVFPHYNYITPSLAYTDKTVSVDFELTETARTEQNQKEQKPAAEQEQKQAEVDSLKAEYAKVTAGARASGEKAQQLADTLKQTQAEVDRLKAEQAKVAADTTAAEAKAQQLAADEAKAQAEADRLNRQLHEEQIKNIVLVDAVTPNQKSTGHAVLQLGLGNRLLDTVLLSKKGDVLNYDALSGEAHASLRGTLLQDAGLVSGAANERIRAAFDGVAARPVPVIAPLAYGPEDKGKQSAGEAFVAAAPAVPATALWGQAYGGWSHGSSDGNAAAYDRNTGGFVTGVDSLIAGTWRLGLLAGYGSTSLHGAGSSTSADSYQLGVYGGTSIDALTLSLGTILAHHAIDTHRSVTFGTLDETESAGYSANTVHLFGEAAYRIDTPYAAFEPFAAAAYTHLKTDGFTETGGIAALSAPASATDLTTTTLGVRASRAFTLGNATTVTARAMAGWRHAYGDVAPQAQFAFASGGESFAVSGQPMAADTALIEAGLAFDVGKATTIGLTYTGAFSSQVKDNAVKADLTVRF